MEINPFQSILVALISTSAMFGLFHVIDNQFKIRTRQKAVYATIFGVCMFVLNLIHPFSRFSDSMVSNRIFAMIVGFSIIGLMTFREYKYETSTAWSSIISSLIFVYLVIFGIGPPVDINPLLFES